MPKTKTAPQFLQQAAQHMQDRANTYDKPKGERSMGAAVAAFNTITGHQLTESDGWTLMSLLKKVRQYQNPTFHRDSAEDDIAYSALAAEAMARESA